MRRNASAGSGCYAAVEIPALTSRQSAAGSIRMRNVVGESGVPKSGAPLSLRAGQEASRLSRSPGSI